MKIGRNFARAKEALTAAGMAEGAIYVERATMAGEVVTPLCDKQDDPRPISRSFCARERAAPVSGRVMIVGLGPGPAEWMTPEASAVVDGRERRRRLRPLCRAGRVAGGPARSCERQSG